jgi:membrane dipeptidase
VGTDAELRHSVFVDGHLDLAYNVLQQRDLTLPLDRLRELEARTAEEAMVTLPELVRAGTGVVFATLFVMPRQHAGNSAHPGLPTYTTPDEARAAAVEQLELYERWEESGLVRIIRSRTDLEQQVREFEFVPDGHSEGAAGARGAAVAREHADQPIGLVLLMEGADPLRKPEEVSWWRDRGVRLLGPAWKQTRYAGGTGEPGPLTEAGRELLMAMSESGLALDVSHLAEESFWQALDLWRGPLLASHSNARAFVNTDRHLSDAMISALAERDAMIGLVLANSFLRAGITRADPKESVTLHDVQLQAEHIANLAGWQRLGIGSDFDGGFGRQEVPFELDRASDFRKLARIAPPEAQQGVLGGNWVEFLRRVLPG